MPIRVQNDLPIKEVLEQENIFVYPQFLRQAVVHKFTGKSQQRTCDCQAEQTYLQGKSAIKNDPKQKINQKHKIPPYKCFILAQFIPK